METLKTNRLLIELKSAPYLIKKSLNGLRNIANYGTRNGKKISGPRFIDSFKNEFALANLMLEQEGLDKLSVSTVDSIINIIDVVIKNQISEPKNSKKENLFNILKEEAVRAA